MATFLASPRLAEPEPLARCHIPSDAAHFLSCRLHPQATHSPYCTTSTKLSMELVLTIWPWTRTKIYMLPPTSAAWAANESCWNLASPPTGFGNTARSVALLEVWGATLQKRCN